jgi:hypothetical protein
VLFFATVWSGPAFATGAELSVEIMTVDAVLFTVTELPLPVRVPPTIG